MFAVAVVGLALAFGPGASTALADGNSSNAHACQKGGYATLVTSDGNVFRNAGDCTSYAAHGGTLLTKSVYLFNQWSAVCGEGLTQASQDEQEWACITFSAGGFSQATYLQLASVCEAAGGTPEDFFLKIACDFS
jgi:hypothetical protein